jgi:large subunit ribosomal protein L28e
MAEVSNDLIWAISRSNSSYLVKRKAAGGLQFSQDPLNVTGDYTLTHSGFANSKAVGVVKGKDGNIQFLSKVQKNSHNPSKSVSVTTFKPYKSQRAVAAAVAKSTRGYRNDLVKAAVVKASALTRTVKAKKVYPPKRR